MTAQSRDTRPQLCSFFDRYNVKVGEVMLEPRREGEPLRRIVYKGRTFLEGDGTGFYGEGEFAELVDV